MPYKLLATRMPGALAVVAAAAAAATAAATDPRPTKQNFSFRSGINYELTADVVPGEFCDPNSPVSLSGYFGVDGSVYDADRSKRYFYWFFERRSVSLLPEDERPPHPNPDGDSDDADDDEQQIPFVVWLNGGPGCSSMLGLLQENGPCLVNEHGNSTSPNPFSWTEAAHMLFLDQPADAGYSYGNDDNDDDVEMIAEDAYYFLQSFFGSADGERYRNLPLFLTGESYAGHYLPAIAKRIMNGNDDAADNNNNDLPHLPLSGVAIGNGMIDEEEQMKWYAEMAFHNPHGIEIVDEGGYEAMKASATSCAGRARECKEAADGLQGDLVCQVASRCEQVFFEPLEARNISVYDISKPCIGPLCEDMTPIKTFLNLPETKEALGVPDDITWKPCDDGININWSSRDRSATLAPVLSEILDADVPVLLYAGDLDYICNYMGVRAVALDLDWGGGDEFRASDDRDWDEGGGLARSAGGLAFLRVYDAGHMVPQDQPGRSLRMIAQFLNGDPF